MYTKKTLEIFANPNNAGRVSKPDGIANLRNADETAHVEFSIRVESGIITKCKFRAQANPYITAICSIITEMVTGKMTSMLLLDSTNVKRTLGEDSDIDIEFCVECMKSAVIDYKEKLEKSSK